MSGTRALVPTAVKQMRGFTLVEVLVSLLIIALMALMSWRGVTSMTTHQVRLADRADRLQTLNATLAQWQHDLDALVEMERVLTWSWDGQTFRMTRMGISPETLGDALQVVAWTMRKEPFESGEAYIERWQSESFISHDDWNRAWANAELWAQSNPKEFLGVSHRLQVTSKFQIYIFRDKSWTNPLSSEGAPVQRAAENLPRESPNRKPAGVRLVFAPTDVAGLEGDLTVDWADVRLRMSP